MTWSSRNKSLILSLPRGGGASLSISTARITQPRDEEVSSMEVPGLQLTAPSEDDGIISRELRAGEEWRFEINFGSTANVKLLAGTAEIFGTELVLNHSFVFTGTKAAVYTWKGCKLEVSGQIHSEYTSDETPMSSYINLHFALEKARAKASIAAGTGSQGPRVMIVGPENAGKTSLVKMLTGYAVRQGRKPTVVNLDPKEGVLSLPGTLTATNFATIMDVEEGFGSSPTSGPSQVPVKLPLVYFFGSEAPERNAKMYKKIVSRLALAVNSRLGEETDARTSGLIIDTSGLTSQAAGIEMIQHIVAELSVDTIVVLGSERHYSDMQRRFQSQISVVKLNKSGGCVDRDEQFMRQVQQTSIRKYFFGEPKRALSPSTVTVDIGTLIIYQTREAASVAVNLSMLPIGHEDDEDALLEKVEIGNQLENCLLAVLNAYPDDSHDVLVESTVMGFLHISEVDEKKRRVKILAPMAGRLPQNALLMGQYPEPTFI